MKTRRKRHLAASLVGLVTACSGDWVGYLLVAPTLGWAFFRAFVIPLRLTPRFRLDAYTRWWALSVVLVVGSLAWWVGLFHHVGMINEWLNAGATRGGTDTVNFRAGLEATLESRKPWIDFSFTPLAIAIGKVAAPVCLLRLFVKRHDEETYALGLLFGAVIQYVAFKEGADVHIFWPHYFAPYFSLALAQLAASIGGVAGMLSRVARPSWRAPAVAAVVGLGVGLLPTVAMARDGAKALWIWRRTGGRYSDRGSCTRSAIDRLFVLKNVVLARGTVGMRTDHYPTVGWGWEELWTMQGESNSVPTPATGVGPTDHPFWVANASGMTGDEQRRIPGVAHVQVYGDMWVVDQREKVAPIDAYSLHEREPNPFEWLFYGGTEPMRSIESTPDPWLTWEWRAALGQPAMAPASAPSTLDEVRIAHNIAVAQGNDAEAAKLLDQIQQQLDLTTGTAYSPGSVRLIGTRLVGGVQPKVESWFECLAPMGDWWFSVHSTVDARDRLSLIDPDPTVREMAWAPLMSTKLWKPHFIYVHRTVLNHRIGLERYAGAWQTRDGTQPARRVDGTIDSTLVLVP